MVLNLSITSDLSGPGTLQAEDPRGWCVPTADPPAGDPGSPVQRIDERREEPLQVSSQTVNRGHQEGDQVLHRGGQTAQDCECPGDQHPLSHPPHLLWSLRYQEEEGKPGQTSQLQIFLSVSYNNYQVHTYHTATALMFCRGYTKMEDIPDTIIQ